MKEISNLLDTTDNYLITEDGEVYSKSKGRFLVGQLNSAGYKMFFLKKRNGQSKWFMAHKIVMYTYGSPKPSEKIEINHIDHNKLNNRVENLKWVTHSENIMASYKQSRKEPYRNFYIHIVTEETKRKMSEAKRKKLLCNNIFFNSIEDCCKHFNTTRRTFNRYLKSGKFQTYFYKY